MQVTLHITTLSHADIALQSTTVLLTQETYREKKSERCDIWFPFTAACSSKIFFLAASVIGSVLLT